MDFCKNHLLKQPCSTLLPKHSGSRHIRKYCALDEDGMDLLETAMNKFALSARAHSRILKISRTIADLAGSPAIRADHVAEAIHYRTLDRKMVQL